MKQEDFLQQLYAELAPLSDPERARVLDYYREMICDRVENGEDEEKLIAGFGAPRDIAAQIIAETRSAAPGEAAALPRIQPNDFIAKGEVHGIVINARQTPVEVRPVSDGPVQVHFRPCENDIVSVQEENGIFTFCQTVQMSLFHWRFLLSGPRMIILDVPVSFAGSLFVSTCNARIGVSNLAHLTEVHLTTSNGHLRLQTVTCDSLTVNTSNGSVDLQDLRGNTCEAETNNAHVTADDCRFSKMLKLYTSNGSIRIHHAVSDKLDLVSSNASVIATIIGDMREYAIRSKTSNAANSLPPEFVYPEQKKSLSVKTSNGKIDVRFIPACE